MKTEDEEIFREHNIRIKYGYTPRYVKGMIGIRFLDDEIRGDKYKTVTNDGELIINYHEMFNNKNSDIIKYFEDKYNVKMSDYRNDSSDYYHYFTCEVGEEDNKMKQIFKDKMVKVVDYVDERWLVAEDVIDELISELYYMRSCTMSDKDIENKVSFFIRKINKLL